jgi:hypothetical protein
LLLDAVIERGEVELDLGLAAGAGAFAQLAADFATTASPDAVRSTRLERLLEEIGRHLPVPADVPEERQAGALLHVVTCATRPGPRLALLEQLLRTDTQHRHAVALTHATEIGVLREVAEDTGTRVIILAEPPDSLTVRAARLRLFARPYDAVLLHTEPFDVVPSLAFAIAPRPPVAVVDDALDHFRLESGFADAVIAFRASVERFAERARGMPADRVARLPRPMPIATRRRTTEAARHALALAPDGLVVLVLASAGVADREALLRELVAELPGTAFLVADARARTLDSECERAGGAQLVDDPPDGVAWDAADVVVDASGRTASPLILEAAARGLATIVHRSNRGTAAAAFDDYLELREAVLVNTSVEELSEQLRSLADPVGRTRQGAMLQAAARIHHAGTSWRSVWGSTIKRLAVRDSDARAADDPRLEWLDTSPFGREGAANLLRCTERQMVLLGHQFPTGTSGEAQSPLAPFVDWAVELTFLRAVVAAAGIATDNPMGDALRMAAKLQSAAAQLDRTEARLTGAIERERALRFGVDEIYASGSYRLATRISAVTKRLRHRRT